MTGVVVVATSLGAASTASVAAGTAAPGGEPPSVRSLCQVLAGRMDAINKGQGPAFLRSWDNAAGEGPHDDPALVGAAFAYDNALAVQALIACGRHDAAGRIAAALADAVLTGARSLPDADRNRVRNAYRAGAQTESPPPPNGWWDDSAGRWVEDPYQVGTATGNAAWVALALLSVAERGARGADDSPPPFSAMLRDEARNAARLIGRWVINATADGDDDDGPGGYTGGIAGAGEGRQAIGWKSTEHNADLAAMFTRLAAIDPDQPDWPKAAARARAFLDAMWAAGKGDHFPTGTLPDGRTINTATSGLDAQLWPLLLADASEDWRAAFAYAEAAHGVDGGFDFNDDRDGIWIEGTAQAALVLRVLDRRDEARVMLEGLLAEQSPGGYLFATRAPSITTGLAIGPDSTTDDFRYHRWPHLGATAWAVLAGLGFNPFIGR
ncbi:hypothetical protein GCM10011505_18750 [Tistrella bauzanensis]|uniref:Methylaspartate ammonia-lyase n=1 Tax=Tistrella bauzanensis TaxID=657419 RepID=A0ABQ1IF65_9PROT|nr:hypothetical protein GCM10011505_18750 [Tistrella bauzanensis]